MNIERNGFLISYRVKRAIQRPSTLALAVHMYVAKAGAL
jgi:hypothetical protein